MKKNKQAHMGNGSDTSAPKTSWQLPPDVRSFPILELRELVKDENLPSFQRWENEKNVTDIEASVKEIGIKRLPIIGFIKSIEKLIVVDGRHLITAICAFVDKGKATDHEVKISDNTTVACIYEEYNTEEEALLVFRKLNTTGKTLDLLDFTQLYYINSGRDRVYTDIWEKILKNPKNNKEYKSQIVKSFSLPTIIEALCGDKESYRLGTIKTIKDTHYNNRLNLLLYLIINANPFWNKTLPAEYKRPTGAAILGFMRTWFSGEFHLSESSEKNFLKIITSIYNDPDIQKKEVVINRDNAGNILRSRLINAVALTA